MKLSVIIPCYNEKEYISQVISLVKASPVTDKELIIVDDGSDDGTSDLIRDKIESQVDKVVYHSKNMGKGSAIKSGLKYITGELVIIQDSDLEYNPQEYPKLMAPIIDGRESEDMKIACGAAIMGMFGPKLKDLADEIIILDSDITGLFSESPVGHVFGFQWRGIRPPGRFGTPGRYFGIPVWYGRTNRLGY